MKIKVTQIQRNLEKMPIRVICEKCGLTLININEHKCLACENPCYLECKCFNKIK